MLTLSSLTHLETAIQNMVREKPGATEIFEICLQSEEGHLKMETMILPSWWPNNDFHKLIQYCAANVNNLAMTRGGVVIECRGTNPNFVANVLEEVETRYPQVSQILSDFYGYNISISHVSRLTCSDNTIIQGPESLGTQRLTEKTGTAIGINIGQTLSKFVAIRNGKELKHTRMIVPTWGNSPHRSFEGLFGSVLETLSNLLLLHNIKDDIDAIGISIGGIVRDGYITSRTGIAAQLSDNDFENLRDLSALIRQRFCVETLLSQDVVAKAYTIRPDYHGRKVLVLDIGTSTGGAYIAADGTIPNYLNQVGRVVVDLSEKAIPRDDGQAMGVLSKYLSYTGFQRLCRQFGFSGDLTNEEFIRIVDAHDQKALELLDNFSMILVEAVTILNRYYNAEIVIITGGFVLGSFGLRLLREAIRNSIKRGIPLPPIKISTNPLFDGAVGVASMAINRLHCLAKIPVQTRRLLRKAVECKLPEAVVCGECIPGPTVMDSVIGREHYTNYNEQFIRRYIKFATHDRVFGEAVMQLLLPEIRDLEQVGMLTPQQVQTVAVRTIAFATGKEDPLLMQKRLANMTVQESVKALTLKIKAKTDVFCLSQEHFAAMLKSLLVISAVFNAFDFFNPKALTQVFGNMYSLSHNCCSEWLKHRIETLADSATESLMAYDEFESFADLLSMNPGRSLLYFMDNAGEAIVDLVAAELLLNTGFQVTLVAMHTPFVDDITISEVQGLIRQSESLARWENSGRLKLSSIESDMSVWGEVVLKEWPQAVGYIAKGMRKLGQLYSPNLTLPGLHVVLNKSDTVRRVIKRERGVSLFPEQNRNVIFLFRSPKKTQGAVLHS